MPAPILDRLFKGCKNQAPQYRQAEIYKSAIGGVYLGGDCLIERGQQPGQP
jgi:hypothetical protein